MLGKGATASEAADRSGTASGTQIASIGSLSSRSACSKAGRSGPACLPSPAGPFPLPIAKGRPEAASWDARRHQAAGGSCGTSRTTSPRFRRAALTPFNQITDQIKRGQGVAGP